MLDRLNALGPCVDVKGARPPGSVLLNLSSLTQHAGYHTPGCSGVTQKLPSFFSIEETGSFRVDKRITDRSLMELRVESVWKLRDEGVHLL